MKRKIFILFNCIFFALLFSTKSFSYNSDPKQFISEVVLEAKGILVATNSMEFKTEKLSEIALKTVDIKGIAYYSLGSYRKELSSEQLEKYLVLFEKYFTIKGFRLTLSFLI